MFSANVTNYEHSCTSTRKSKKNINDILKTQTISKDRRRKKIPR